MVLSFFLRGDWGCFQRVFPRVPLILVLGDFRSGDLASAGAWVMAGRRFRVGRGWRCLYLVFLPFIFLSGGIGPGVRHILSVDYPVEDSLPSGGD